MPDPGSMEQRVEAAVRRQQLLNVYLADPERAHEVGPEEYMEAILNAAGLPSLLAELERLAAENEKLEARIAELEDALAPFVDEYEAVNFNFAPDRLPLVVFEAARSALAPVQPESDG